MNDNSQHADGTKPGAGEPPHEGWQNRDYDEDAQSHSDSGRWVKLVAAVLSAIMAAGLLWSGVIEPLLK